MLRKVFSTVARSWRQVPRVSTRAMGVAGVDPSQLKIYQQPRKLKKEPLDGLLFGKNVSDHMLRVEWSSARGWDAPKIVPFGPISLDPAASCLHYGLEIFEGMKAYRAKDGIRLFRPLDNMERMRRSAKRISLPDFEAAPMVELLKELVKVDQDWVPDRPGYSLYIRPTLISTEPTLGVGPANQALFYIVTCPVGPFFPTGFAAVKLWATDKFVRAWAGGTGEAKCGGNYAATIMPQAEATAKGCQQVLWLYNREVTEVGTMNVFVHWINENGEKELVTAPIDDRGIILPGITRQSTIELAKELFDDIKVSERVYTIDEVEKAAEEGRLLEAFGTGTACVVSPIKSILHNDKEIRIPLDPNDPSSEAGPVAVKIHDELKSIQYGIKPHDNWSVLIE